MARTERAATIVSLDRVSFSYEGAAHAALDDVSLTVGRGEFLGIIGPSGAGKTTLTHVLSGAVPHHFSGTFQGVCTVDGRDTCTVGLTDVSRVLGSVLQDIDAQMVASNVEDEMLYGLENFGVPHGDIPARVLWALHVCGIAELLHRDISTLSGGQKQKVAIAAILALRPQILVLDEPTAALDPVSSRAVFETLRELNHDEGITVLVVEQKVALLAEFCSRLCVLADGRVERIGTPREVFAHAGELRRVGVDSPRSTRISNRLASLGLLAEGEVCLTPPEVEDAIAHVVGEDASAPSAVQRGSSPASVVPFASSTTCDPVLSFAQVGFAYPGNTASVRGLTFDVRPQELLAVIGQNGAGKTTMTKLMNGLLKPDEGSVTICGLDTRQVRTSELAQHVSTLFQDPNRQICKDTVVEEVAFSLGLLGIDHDEALRRAEDTVGHFSLPGDAAPFSLGRGQRQIVALASVVVTNPRVLILDEPTSGLDYHECMVVMDAVEAAREQGCAVIMVCHDMEVVSDFASRLVVMAQGRIVADGDTRRVFSDDAVMRQAFVDAPEVMRIARALDARVSRAFSGATEVSDIVSITKGLVG